MKALTISQPFATLIAQGEKWVENRSWPTGYRGPLAIHAGEGTQYLDREQLADYPTGQVIAVAQLVACVHLHAVQKRDPLPCDQLLMANIDPTALLAHEHAEGPWCWVFKEVRQLLRGVLCRGSQGLWDFYGLPELAFRNCKP